MNPFLLFALLAGLVLACPARAETGSAMLFADGVFDVVPDGQSVTYSHVRKGDASPDFRPVADGRITVVTGRGADGTRSLSMTIQADDQRREIVDFPASAGNPVLMVFLESAVRSMAAITGGSPFYIRNRIKEALRQGGEEAALRQDFAGNTVAAQEVTLHPFKTDPNRERMGVFADLSLRFVVSEGAPGRFLLLSADTPEAASGYHETIALTGSGDGE